MSAAEPSDLDLNGSDAGSPAAGSTLPRSVAVAALAFGALAGAFEILNTSIGWHLAAGRWMLEHRSVLRFNPFTFSAEGVPWLDHEWLFQVVAALVDRLGDGPALVVSRMVVVALLSLLLTRIGHRHGLSAGPALVLAALCVFGARMRFYVRPELATLLLVPIAVDLYLRRLTLSTARVALGIATVAVVGINFHAGILALLPLLGVLWIGETLRNLLARANPLPEAASGAAVLAAATLGVLVNPWGWKVLFAPVHLSRLVGRPYVPNPEWISPGPTDVPALFVAIAVAAVAMLLRERNPVRWFLFIAATALALRYVRNVGLFFVLLPLFVTPTLVRLLPVLRTSGRRIFGAGAVAVGLLAAGLLNAPGFPFGFDFSKTRYPEAAGAFMDDQGLFSTRVYNDVRFGGWLIGNNYPPFRAFIDDRNEIHEAILAEIWAIQSASSPGRWQEMLEGWGITTALLRYHDPVPVVSPEGRPLGLRGSSALWFPSKRWALVYWDDVAMILVDRLSADDAWLQRFEYTLLRPDDVDHLAETLRRQPELIPRFRGDLSRKLDEDPGCRRARAIERFLFFE